MDASVLCSLATVTPGGRAHINHMYFAWNERFDVFWYSDPGSVHSRNLDARRTAGITIYDSRQINGRPDRGIQLFGAAGAVAGRTATAAARAYAARFPNVDPSAFTAYRFRPRQVKLFDEPALATATVVTAKVTPVGLAWTKTEVWVTA